MSRTLPGVQMLLLIDNYDSFTYNLVHYLGELGAETTVRRNDELNVQDAMGMGATGIVLSPGPCAEQVEWSSASLKNAR